MLRSRGLSGAALITVIASCALGIATPAAGARTIVPNGLIWGGPFLHDDRIVWGDGTDGRLLVRTAGTTGPPQELLRITVPPPARPPHLRTLFGLEAAEGGPVVSRSETSSGPMPYEPVRYSVLIGKDTWFNCTQPRSFPATADAGPGPAADGAAIAVPGAGCRGDTILVRYPGRTDVAVSEYGPVIRLRVAGSWLAAAVSVDGRAFVLVHDLTRPDPSFSTYSMPLDVPSFAYGYVPMFSFDLRADGTIVVNQPRPEALASGATGSDEYCRTWWASPGEPRRHVLPFGACGPVRLRGRTLLVVRTTPSLDTLLRTTLAGAPPAVVHRAPGIDSVDLAGGLVAWRQQGCLRETVQIRALAQRPGGQPPGCAIRVLSRGPLRMDRRGRIRVVVRCPGGCEGIVHLLRCRHRRCIDDPARVRLRAGGRRTLTLTLTPRTRRLVRRGNITALIKTTPNGGSQTFVRRTITARPARAGQ